MSTPDILRIATDLPIGTVGLCFSMWGYYDTILPMTNLLHRTTPHHPLLSVLQLSDKKLGNGQGRRRQ